MARVEEGGGRDVGFFFRQILNSVCVCVCVCAYFKSTVCYCSSLSGVYSDIYFPLSSDRRHLAIKKKINLLFSYVFVFDATGK